MASTTTELIDNGTKVDGRGRRIVTPQEREALIAAYRRSGLTQQAFAQREGIKYSTFTSWIEGRRRGAVALGKPVFAEVAMLPGGAAAANTPGELSVQLPDGTLVRGTAASEIVGLIRALRGAIRC
jgi:transposase-like protein